ncbi:MAG: SsrA-binding protein [Flavobacteriales bacterium]
MTKSLFRVLAKLNKALLPKMWDKNLLRLSKTQKLIIAWRIWVTKNALD